MKTNAHTKLGNHGSPNPSSKGNRTHENTSNDNELDLTTCLQRMVSHFHCYNPNQRARRLEPKCSLSARMATDGS